MHSHDDEHYYGSYGLVRGYGTLYRTFGEADDSVYDDNRLQRRNGGCSDRSVVIVSPDTGLCWWWEEGPYRESDLAPVRDANGVQARYSTETIRLMEDLWEGPTEIAGFA